MATFLKGTVKAFYTPLLLLCFVYNIPLRSLKILGSSHWHLMHYIVKIDAVFSSNGEGALSSEESQPVQPAAGLDQQQRCPSGSSFAAV